MRAWCYAAAAVALALAAVLVVGVVLLHGGGMSARAEPSAVEIRVARALQSLSIPSEARDAVNPVPAGPEAVAAGLAHFAGHCATCHGNDGSGRTPIGQSLYPRAPDMRRRETQALTDGELFHIIEEGVRLTGMPAWGGRADPEESWQLVRFIRHLPDLTPGELQRMEALNPRTPEELRTRADEDAFLRGEGPAPREGRQGRHAH